VSSAESLYLSTTTRDASARRQPPLVAIAHGVGFHADGRVWCESNHAIAFVHGAKAICAANPRSNVHVRAGFPHLRCVGSSFGERANGRPWTLASCNPLISVDGSAQETTRYLSALENVFRHPKIGPPSRLQCWPFVGRSLCLLMHRLLCFWGSTSPPPRSSFQSRCLDWPRAASGVQLFLWSRGDGVIA
jgi:hypothetical protein